VVGLLRGIAERKSIKLVVTPSPGVAVLADHAMIHSVIQNLVGNALKFTEKDGSITLSSRVLDGWVEIEVADTGIGVSPQMLENIRSRAAGNTTSGTEGETGTGLGLNLSQGFVDKHGGRFSAVSEIGKGTTFRFTLPRARP
jgi:signal transduction histidine kinase